MNNIKCLKYLLKHKYYVARECFKNGLYWRGIVHDLSKFTPLEWIAYRNYFYGTYKPYNEFGGIKFEFDCWAISKEGVQEAFDYAWLHHQHKNKHHWQYWCLKNDDGSLVPMKMPEKYIKEMICDWIGAGLAIHGKREAKEWYWNNRNKMIFNEYTRTRVEQLLNEMI